MVENVNRREARRRLIERLHALQMEVQTTPDAAADLVGSYARSLRSQSSLRKTTTCGSIHRIEEGSVCRKNQKNKPVGTSKKVRNDWGLGQSMSF
jgi:hypothetical protein